MSQAEIVVDQPGKNVTIKIRVRYSREFKVRTWIAARLMRLAGWVYGANVDMDEEMSEEE